MNKTAINPTASAMEMTRLVLTEIDKLYPGKRKVLQAELGLRNGIFSRS
ncbi:MAG: hypothetical protein MJZ67_08670 [Bacteroidales bacterium]|nr:hypothetical protein [Bacteroidales bacterium]